MSKWHDSKSLKMKFVFLIAGKELYKWKSKHTRIAARMMESYTQQRIIKLLEDCHPVHKWRDEDGDVEIIRYTDQLIRFGIDTDEKLKEWSDKGDEYFYVSMNPWYEVISVNDKHYFSEPIFDVHEAINFAKELQDKYTDGVVND